jgi:hypothetical protein
LKISNCDKECKNIILNTELPFCSPTINADWPEEFARYLNQNGGNLGVLNSCLGNEPRDFYIKQSFTTTTDIISGECKYREKGLDYLTILDIIAKLSKFDSKLNLIVTNKLSENILISNLKLLETEEKYKASLNFCLFKAIRNREDNSVALDQIFQHLSYEATNVKVFIIVVID